MVDLTAEMVQTCRYPTARIDGFSSDRSPRAISARTSSSSPADQHRVEASFDARIHRVARRLDCKLQQPTTQSLRDAAARLSGPELRNRAGPTSCTPRARATAVADCSDGCRPPRPGSMRLQLFMQRSQPLDVARAARARRGRRQSVRQFREPSLNALKYNIVPPTNSGKRRPPAVLRRHTRAHRPRTRQRNTTRAGSFRSMSWCG